MSEWTDCWGIIVRSVRTPHYVVAADYYRALLLAAKTLASHGLVVDFDDLDVEAMDERVR